MNKKITFFILMALPLFAFSQLKNDGANIVIQAGATLYVEGDIENINAGTITNNGTIEVQGDFENSATITSDPASKLVFSGASSSNMTSGGAVFANVDMNKAAGNNVVLQDAFSLVGILDFLSNNNKFNCNAQEFIFGASASHNGVDADDYIVTDGGGKVTKADFEDGDTFTFPIGANASTFNPFIATGETGHQMDDISVEALTDAKEDGLGGADFTDGVVDAMWDVTEGAATGSVLGLTGIYKTGLDPAGDELPGFDPMNCGLSHYIGGEWDLTVADLTSAIASGSYAGYSEVSRSGLTSLSPFVIGGEKVADYVTVSPIVNLTGPWNGTDMDDDLRAAGIIPTSEPYTAMTQFTHKGFGGNESVDASVFTTTGNDAVVDWVFIEARDKSDNTNVLATKAALLQRDGDIVELDNSSPLKISGLGDDDYFLVVRHRNHLGIMTLNATALDQMAPMVDFASGSATTFGTDAQKDLGGGTTFGMWGGNASLDDYVRASQTFIFPVGIVPSDRDIILNTGLGGNVNGQLTTYNVWDVNMDAYTRASQTFIFPVGIVPSDRDFILNNILAGVVSGQRTQQLPN